VGEEKLLKPFHAESSRKTIQNRNNTLQLSTFPFPPHTIGFFKPNGDSKKGTFPRKFL
jgi:hypothetical protein